MIFRHSRRPTRKVLVACIVLGLLFWHLSPLPSSARTISNIEFVPSSFDWSTLRQFHPPSSIKPIPTESPQKLPQVQASRSKFQHTSAIKSRQKAVRDEFLRSYRSYKQYAWMKDELMPVSAKGKDNFGGWAATLVDSLDTLWIMGLREEFGEAARAAATLDWAKTDEGAVNLFETTIRHLGGLLSAYELSGEPVLLRKAIELGEMLYVAFDTPNRLPGFWLNFNDARNGKQVAGVHDPSASPGSLVMEFTKLSQLTRDPKFYDATDRVTQFLIKAQNKTRLPGMWPVSLDFQNEQANDNTFSLGALADSLYEYLPKMHILLGGVDKNYESMYRTAMDVVIKNLLYRPMLPEKNDILFSGDVHVNDKAELSTESQHLTCFAGGMFALGGKVLNIPEHVGIGERLARGCGWAYKAFPTGMMPEIFNLMRCPTLEPCDYVVEQELSPPGFRNARDPRYLLRPEAIESIFIMYRITADPQWQDMAWDMFQAIVRYTKTPFANAAIEDVKNVETAQTDSMESFWLSETLKYFYLIFSPPDLVSLDETRKKRGPKGGPRTTTKEKVERFQQSIKDKQTPSNQLVDQSQSDPSSPTPLPPYHLPLHEYQRFLEISKRPVSSIWMVINPDDLFNTISQNPHDYESHALAASLCAATIAQLRLPEHAGPRNTTSSLQFAAECLQLRELYDYRESYSLASCLIPFFLHVYHSNGNKLRTAGLFLRESVTQVQLMQLGNPETYLHLSKQEQSLRLRIYWLVLITERTYSAQHGLQAVLQVIDVFPDTQDEMADEQRMHAFISLTKIFAYLESNLTTFSSNQQPLERQKLVSYQAALCSDSHDHAAREAQRVDLFVTRQWVRLILWEYTARHFAMSCCPDDEAFSLFLPMKIGHKMLSLLSMVTNAAIKTHGYGIELKVFRLADAMLDIVACTPFSAHGSSMLVGAGEILHSLQHVLHSVGGQESGFLQKIQTRMSQLELTTGSWPYLAITEAEDAVEEIENDHSL
ncbi:hypothetical protein F53441_4516 [Fusarium austroafricanum]|uniref:alpha-1,2-Mannosidase n=1 Tax=Fusarium austroafricanum TaxID=2364996 RepID=A0A8H4KNQ3_9HYPO|nr:hypothetical protein F53441_4516 [Fusarium austroafricanum]